MCGNRPGEGPGDGQLAADDAIINPIKTRNAPDLGPVAVMAATELLARVLEDVMTVDVGGPPRTSIP